MLLALPKPSKGGRPSAHEAVHGKNEFLLSIAAEHISHSRICENKILSPPGRGYEEMRVDHVNRCQILCREEEAIHSRPAIHLFR
jgi:hypothetical protein